MFPEGYGRNPESNLFACQRCGALVAAHTVHDKWHEYDDEVNEWLVEKGLGRRRA